MNAPDRPLLIFDGDCGFCRAWIARWRRDLSDRIDFAPSQSTAAAYPEIPAQRFVEAVVLVEPDGTVRFGAAAVFRALAYAPGRGLAWWAYRRVPGVAAVTEWCYRLVASHRGAAASVTRALWGAHVAPPGERITAWVFVRMLGIVEFVAFASLAFQVRGLAGREGILPAASYLQHVAAHFGPIRFALVPTLAWFGAGDGALMGLCVAGMVASALVALGVAPRMMLLVAWATYLSLVSVGGEFLWFQWDSLLLEAGLAGALLAPWSLRSRPRDAWRPTRAAVWLSRWILARLVFSSAAVKWASHDPTWRSLTALRYHYETQPLPPWTAWYAHHLPAGFHAFSAAAMFALEGLPPLLVVAPRRLRLVGAGGIAFLQVLIMLSGNYGIFNWLTLALCVMLLDDGVWPGTWAGSAEGTGPASPSARGRAGRRATTALACALGALGLVPLVTTLGVPPRWLGPLRSADEALQSFRSVNAYGLFAVMTTQRLEIELEGSDDGTTWKPYGFRYKPGDPARRPEFVPGHMPRLDWQMWFAALDPAQPAPWFLNFSQRVLEGSRPVLDLLGTDPFAGRPPRLLRATLYRYRFSSPEERRARGVWWTRERVGAYLPPVTLQGGILVLAP